MTVAYSPPALVTELSEQAEAYNLSALEILNFVAREADRQLTVRDVGESTIDPHPEHAGKRQVCVTDGNDGYFGQSFWF